MARSTVAAGDPAQAGPSKLPLPPYLASALTVVKALKGAQDPPQPDWPSKIAIARQAWERDDLYMLRKEEFLREWIVESWMRSGGKGKGKAVARHPLTDPAYFELLHALPLEDIQQKSPFPAIQPILQTFFAVLPSATLDGAQTAELLGPVSRLVARLIKLSKTHSAAGSATIGKAEVWIETWQAAMRWLAQALPVEAGGTAEGLLADIESLIGMIVHETKTSLQASANRKKIAQTMLTQDFEPLRRVLSARTQLNSLFEGVIGPLLFPVPILQLPGGFQAALSAVSSRSSTDQAKTSKDLHVVAPLLRSYIAALQASRYSTFQPPARSDVPAEIYVSGRVRNAVLSAVEACLKHIDQVARTQPASAGGDSPWEAVQAIWAAIERSSTYFEGETGWPRALQSTIRQIDHATASSAAGRAADGPPIRAALRTCLVLDYSCAARLEEGQILRRILAWSLTSSDTYEEQTLGVWHVVLAYHSLTKDMTGLFALLDKVIQAACECGQETDQHALYLQLASSALFQQEFASAIGQALQSTLAGSIQADRGWGAVYSNLAASISGLAENADFASLETAVERPSKKKRKSNSGTGRVAVSTAVRMAAARLALLSRVHHILVAAATTRNTGELIGNEDMIKLLSDRGQACLRVIPYLPGAGEMDWSRDVLSAAHLRIRTDLASLGLTTQDLTDLQIVPSQGELSYESTRLTLETDISIATQISNILDVLGKRTTAEWSGRISEARAEKTAIALWQLFARCSFQAVDSIASDAQVRMLAELLVRSQLDSANIAQGFSRRSAVDRLVHSAELWEMGRLRAHILDLLVCKDVDISLHDKLAFVRNMPSDYLSRAVRNQLVSSSLQAFAGPRLPVEQAKASMRFLFRIGRDSEYLGDLASKPELLQKMMSLPVIDTDESDEELRHLTVQHLRTVFRSLWLQVGANSSHDCLRALCKSLADDSANFATLAQPAALAFMHSARSVHASFDSLPEDLRDGLTLLAHLTTKHIRSAIQAGQHKLSMLRGWSTCCHVDRWMRASRTDSLGQGPKTAATSLVMRSVLGADSLSADLAGALLEMLAAEQAEDGAHLHWLAVFIVISHRAGPSAEAQLTAVFTTVLGKISAEELGQLLSSTIEQLEAIPAAGKSMSRALLYTLRLLFGLDVAGAGKTVRSNVQQALGAVSRAASAAPSVDVLEGSVAMLDALVSTRAMQLKSSDIAEIFAICHGALQPLRIDRVQTTSPGIFLKTLEIINHLVRQRRDLIAEVMPQLVAVLQPVFTLLSRPRSTNQSERVADAFYARLPPWIARTDEGLGKDEASALSRCLVTLTSRTVLRRPTAAAELNGADKSVGTLIGPLSKHAPALLVSYVRALVDPLSGLPLDTRRRLEPGLHALCEAVVAGGKAQFRTGEGFGAGAAFGLADGLEGRDADAEMEVWAEMWAGWRKRRYAGQG